MCIHIKSVRIRDSEHTLFYDTYSYVAKQGFSTHVLLSQKMMRVLSYTGFVHKVYTVLICSGYQNPGLRKIVSTTSLQAKMKRW